MTGDNEGVNEGHPRQDEDPLPTPSSSFTILSSFFPCKAAVENINSDDDDDDDDDSNKDKNEDGRERERETTSTYSNNTIPHQSSILDKYDGFLVDQWGVMHNGVECMPGAIDCIRNLAVQYRKKLVIVSNSPASEEATLQALIPLGFDPKCFVGGAVTSGTLATTYIRQHFSNAKVLLMGWKNSSAPSPHEFVQECQANLALVTSMDEHPQAIIVQGNEIIVGSTTTIRGSGGDNDDDDAKGEEDISLGDFLLTGRTEGILDTLLQCAVDRQLPLLCVDPDFVVVNPNGSTLYMPGTIAKRYEELGGLTIVNFGKPHASMFQEGIRRLQQQLNEEVDINDAHVVDTRRFAMIGDSLHHDVTGANAVGLDSILVLGGVHRNELNLAELGHVVPRDQLQALFDRHGQTPTYVLPILR